MAARIRVRDAGGTLRTITRIRVRDASGTLRTVTRVRGRDTGGTLQIFFDSLSVTISPAEATGLRTGTGTASVSTGAVLATATGGASPYTYAWTQTGTSPYTWTIGSAAAAATDFTAASLPEGVVASTYFTVTATDANGVTDTQEIYATARNNNTLSGGGTGEPYDPGYTPGRNNSGMNVN